MRAVGVTTSPLTRLVLELALRARRRHRVCRLLFELHPRLAQSSAERSDRPAAADGRVCWTGQPRPASLRSLCASLGVPRHRAPSRDLSGSRCLTHDLNRHVHSASRTLRRLRDLYASLPARIHSRDRRGTTSRARHPMPTSLRSQRFQPARVQGHTRRRARPRAPLQGRRQTANNRFGYDARACASVPTRIDSQTAAANDA